MTLPADGTTLPPRAIVEKSFHVFVAHFWPLLGAYLLFALITQGTSIFGIVLLGPLWLGLSKMCLAGMRGRPVRFEELFDGFKLFAPSCLAGLVMTAFAALPTLLLAIPVMLGAALALSVESRVGFVLAILIGSVGGTLCLLPFCAVAILYTPTFFFLADGEQDWWPAMEASRKMVQRNLKQWMRLWAALSILHLLGLLTCCVGTIFATPWMLLALAEAYDIEQAGRTSDEAPVPPPFPPDVPPQQ